MSPRVRAWYRNLPLRFKIMAWLVPVLLATVAITGAFSYYVAMNLAISKIRQGQTAIANQAVTQIGYLNETLMDTYDYLYLTPELHEVVENQPMSTTSQPSVIAMIDELMVTREYLGSLIIYSNQIAPIASQNGNSAVIPYDAFRKYSYIRQAIANPSRPVYAYVTPALSPFLDTTHNQVLFVHAYQSLRTLGVEGVVVIGISQSDLQHIVQVPLQSQLMVFLVSNDGHIIADSRGQWMGQRMSTVPLFAKNLQDNNAWVMADAVSPENGWGAIVVQSKSDVVAQLERIRWLTGAFAAAVFCVGLVLSYWAASSITSPLRRMLFAMEQVQSGNFEVQVETDRGDELGQLGLAFNAMVGRIKALIRDIYQVRLRQREAEIRLLQSQMNPHFLYNTLNLIAWTAQSRNDSEIAEMIYSLSDVFRTSLSDGRDNITLREEFELLENYLKLQRFRLPDRLDYQIELPEKYRDIVVPKLSIQPFVENAIVHGLEGSQDKTFVEVRVSPESSGLRIEVQDNGAGMTKSRLHEIRERLTTPTLFHNQDLESERQRAGYAFASVLERLRSMYGHQVQLFVKSTAGMGTLVTILMPLQSRTK